MILKQYGSSYQSVETNFNPTAMTEIGFRRDRAFSIAVDEFDGKYEEVSRTDLTAEAEGTVQGEVEKQLLTHSRGGVARCGQGPGRGRGPGRAERQG